MIKRLVLFSWLLATFMNSDVFSQSRLEIKDIFYDAESWILFEDYKEALPKYQQLLKINPTNSNYKYRIGQCYINTPGEKEKAISYLEDAVKNISPDYKEGKFRETKAPYDALYYLANAYRINYQIDKALETYRLFKQNMDPEVYDSNIVNLQIQSCLNAKELMHEPLFIKEKNVSASINESTSEFNPVVSDNEDLMVFSRSEAFYDAILYSVRKNGAWSGPQNLNELLKVDKDLFPTSISSDGKTLYLYSSADYDGIIYSSTLKDGAWSPIMKLNDNINTKFWESHATISHDNKKLYFTSNRKGTYGGLDIYVSKRDSSGDWGSAENMGPVINTPYNEESPFLSQDDKTLFFSSRGHFNMGGYDIFYSTLLPNGQWSVPLNAGYPLNSTDDDLFFKPLAEGYIGYYAKYSPQGYGKQDIYRIEIFSDDHPRKFLVRGLVRAADLMSNFKDSIKVLAMNVKNPNQTVVVYSNPNTGEYQFELPQGNYQITYQGEGTEKVTKNIELPLTNPSDSFVLPGTVLPKTDFTADLNVNSNKSILVSSGDTVVFPIRAEPKSILEIEHWSGDSLLYTEKFIVTDSVFNYKLVPGKETRLTFRLTDKFNNITSTDVLITKEKGVTKTIQRPEYSHIIAQKQIAALAEMLRSRSEGRLRDLISSLDLENRKFGQVDDLISYIKEEGAKKNISADEIDRLALIVAVKDNVLTQAAVDYLARHTQGDLKNILENLNIYNEKLKTWTDLQEYVSSKTNGAITPEELNRITDDILSDVDSEIPLMREKILAYSKISESGAIIRESIATVDLSNIKLKEKWLAAFCNETLKQGLSANQMADMLAAISNVPGTTAKEFLNDLIRHAEEPLLSSLKELNLKRENIKTPSQLISFLLTAKDQSKYPQELIYKAIADVIAEKNIPEEKITTIMKTEKSRWPWVIALAVAGAAILLFVLFRERKNEEKKKE